MSKALITEQLITDIADSIRDKTGSTDKMTPAEMPEKINGFISLESVEDGSYLFCNRDGWITEDTLKALKNLKRAKSIFYGMDPKKAKLLQNLDVSKVVDFQSFFDGTVNTEAWSTDKDTVIDLSTWDFSNAGSLTLMFGEYTPVYTYASITIGEKFKTSKVQNFAYLMSGFRPLNTTQVKDFLEKMDTSNGKDFRYCLYALGDVNCDLDLRSWKMDNANNVTFLLPASVSGSINAEGWTFNALKSSVTFNITDNINYKGWTFANEIQTTKSTIRTTTIDLSSWKVTFYGLSSLAYNTNTQKVILSGDNVNLDRCKTIYTFAYSNTNLKYVVMGNDDTTWGITDTSSAFYNCSSLETLIIRGTNVMTNSSTSTFTNSAIAKGTGYIYVADDLVDSYKTATNWSVYADQIKPLSEAPAEPEV